MLPVGADCQNLFRANYGEKDAKKYPNITLDVFDGEAQRPYVEKGVKADIFAIATNARIANIKGASSVDPNPYEQAAVNARAALNRRSFLTSVLMFKL